MEIYDLIIIGGSAAATAAGIYAARRGLNFIIITKEFGGEMATAGEIGNWPGENQTDGIVLVQKFRDHLDFYKAPLAEGIEVEKVTKQSDGLFCLSAKSDGISMAMEKMGDQKAASEKCDYLAKTVIIGTGGHPKELKVPGEREFRNKGVSYCTVCDGPVFGGKVTAVIGGGNSALEATLMLADICPQVYVINKNPQFKGEQILIDKVVQKKNVQIIYSAQTTAIIGEGFVDGLKYINTAGAEQTMKVDGVFVHIGMVPNSQLVPDNTQKDQFGQIIVNASGETNIPGLYAAGDVTNTPHKQIIIAAGMGTTALLSAVNYLNRMH